MAAYAEVYAFHKCLVVVSDLLCNELFIDCVKITVFLLFLV